MKRIIRLTESDLTKLVRRIINEDGLKPKPNVNIGDKIKDKIEKALEPTAEEKLFLEYVEKIKSYMVQIFDKTYFKPYDKEKDVTESSFLTDIDNFKKIVTLDGGTKPVTNKNNLQKRIEYDEGRRWSGVDRDGLLDIKDFYNLMYTNGELKRVDAAKVLKNINSKLKTLSTDIGTALTNIKTATQPPRLKTYQEREMDRQLHKMKYGSDFSNPNISTKDLMKNPWSQKPLDAFGGKYN